MGAGSKIYCVRIDPLLEVAMKKKIESLNRNSRKAQRSVSDFIRECIFDSLAKRERSNNKPRKAKVQA